MSPVMGWVCGWKNCRYSIVNTDDDGFMIASQTRSYGKGGSDGMIVKFNINGKKQWSKVFGGKGMDYFKSIERNSSDSFIVGGGTRSFSNGDSQGWALLIDKNGYPIWENQSMMKIAKR